MKRTKDTAPLRIKRHRKFAKKKSHILGILGSMIKGLIQISVIRFSDEHRSDKSVDLMWTKLTHLMNFFLKKRFVLLRNSSFSNRKQITFGLLWKKFFPQFRKCFVLWRKKLFKRSKSDLFCFVWEKVFKLNFKEIVDRKFLWGNWVHRSKKFAI